MGRSSLLPPPLFCLVFAIMPVYFSWFVANVFYYTDAIKFRVIKEIEGTLTISHSLTNLFKIINQIRKPIGQFEVVGSQMN